MFVGLVTAAVVAAILLTATASEVTSSPLPSRAKHVVIFGFDHVGMADLGEGDTPNLDRLEHEGAVAATSIRTLAHRSTTAAGYASLGASVRISAGLHSAVAYDRPSGTGVVVPEATATRKLADGLHLSSGAGALGDALRAARLRTAAVGNADTPGATESPSTEVDRPAALAVMDRHGNLDGGAVNRGDVLMADVRSPFGVRADPAKVVAATQRSLADASVVVVDPGDLERAEVFTLSAAPGPARAQARAALRRTDALLGRLRAALPSDTLLIATALSRPDEHSYLAPTMFAGAGVGHGYLVSPSTKRLGVVTITDLAPTVLAVLRLPPAPGMIGRPLRLRAGHVSVGLLNQLDQGTATRESTYVPISEAFIIVQALIYFVAASRRTRGSSIAGVTRVAAVAIAAFPLSTFLIMLLPASASGPLRALGLLAIEAAVVAVAFWRRGADELAPLTAVLGATIGVLVLDTATGSHLQLSSWLGYSLFSAGRFYGLPNTTYAVLATCALLWACVHVSRAGDRRTAVIDAAALFVVVTIVLVTPTLGANVGAILTLVPVFGVTIWVLAGRSITWRTLGVVTVGSAAVLAAVFVVDALRPAASRTHIGTFVSSVHGGPGVLLTTIARKELANIHIARTSIWTWGVLVGVIAIGYMLRSRKQRAALLPAGSSLRVSAISAAALAIIGLGTSDSGPIFIALVFAYMGPLLLLRDVAQGRGSGQTAGGESEVHGAAD